MERHKLIEALKEVTRKLESADNCQDISVSFRTIDNQGTITKENFNSISLKSKPNTPLVVDKKEFWLDISLT